MGVSIIVPVYNEEKFIEEILVKLIKLKLDKEIICIDDFSSDKSLDILKKFEERGEIILLSNKKNMGKGYSIRKGFRHAKEEVVAIQDADLEYDVNDLEKLIKRIQDDDLEVIFGSRFLRKNDKGLLFYYLGNRFLSFMTSLIYVSRVTDMETCYKVMKRKLVLSLNLTSNGFEIEPEMVAKILRKGIKIKEMPIKYNPRGHEEGKKIRLRDGFISLWTLVKYRFIK